MTFVRAAALSTAPHRLFRKPLNPIELAKRAAARAKTAALQGKPDTAMPADRRIEAQKQYLFDAPNARLAQHRARPPPTAEERARWAVVEAAWKVHADAVRERRAEALRYQSGRVGLALDVLRAEDPALYDAAVAPLDREVFEDPVLEGGEPILTEFGPLLPHWRKVPVLTPGRGGWKSDPLTKMPAAK